MKTATPNVQSKSILARLLADEDIQVTHDATAKTAAFDLKNRTLILPCWKDMGNSLYDMLVGHEVSHALNTPGGTRFREAIDTLMSKYGVNRNIAQSYVNIVEDARIERMIKAKFPGLRRDFLNAYRDLLDRDLFEIQGRNIEELCFMDRFNLFFKVGIHAGISIPFSPSEQAFVDAGETTKTWQDVLNLTSAILQDLPIEDDDDEDEDSDEDEGEGEGESEESDTDGEKTDSEESDTDGESNGKGKGGDGGPNGDNDGDDSDDISGAEGAKETRRAEQPITDKVTDNLSKEMEEDNHYKWENPTERMLPTPILENIILDFKPLYAHLYSKAAKTEGFSTLANKTAEFIRASNTTVNVLAKQFEMKKSADAHKRSMTAKTGTLDTVKMMGYRWNEDIFRKATIVPNGKNHGLVMFLDWSGSMSEVIDETMDQMIQLVLFCKKVNIPFEVYAFTGGNHCDVMRDSYLSPNNEDVTRSRSWEEEDPICGDFTLMNIFSSRMNRQEFKAAVIGARFMSHASSNCGHNNYTLPRGLGLSSTPLNQAIIAAMTIIPAFRKKNNLQVVNSVFMTDGYSDNMSCNNKDYLRSKGDRISCPIETDITTTLIKMLQEKTETNAIGMFLATWTPKRFETSAGQFFNYDPCNIIPAQQTWKESNYAIATNSRGYAEQFLIKADKKVETSNLLEDLDENASRSKIKSTFLKSIKSKMVSRTVLNRFIDIIA